MERSLLRLSSSSFSTSTSISLFTLSDISRRNLTFKSKKFSVRDSVKGRDSVATLLDYGAGNVRSFENATRLLAQEINDNHHIPATRSTSSSTAETTTTTTTTTEVSVSASASASTTTTTPTTNETLNPRIIKVPAKSNRRDYVPSDEFLWCKYGERPIKRSPHPRRYYKCSTTRGCPARKHVQSCLEDPSMLIVTYVVEHNHPPLPRVKRSFMVPAISNKLAEIPPDNFSWTFYGQHLIKGSPHPRRYYKCSSMTCCPARKQVQRCFEDPSMLIVTYAGEHNHHRILRVKSSIKVPTIGYKLAGILPDEFSWLKDGQRPIQGSPHPRIYYKCKCCMRGCPARKRVQRCLEDPSMLIVTYVGEHNHSNLLAQSANTLTVLHRERHEDLLTVPQCSHPIHSWFFMTDRL